MRVYLLGVLLLLCAIGCPLCGQDHSKLTLHDVQKVMSEIFSQHVSKKEMTSDILLNSFRVYIDQFDPDRVYLLESEVTPFLRMSPTALEQVMREYKANKYPQYAKLNDVIQKAIERSRAYRATIEKNPTEVFQDRTPIALENVDDESDPNLSKPFLKTVDELDKRTRNYLLRFIALERRRYGTEHVDARPSQTMRFFENQVRVNEDPYLYLNGDNIPMNPSDQENTFALHVLKAMASGLDAHTTVMNNTEAYDMRVRLEKAVHGIGIVITKGPKGDLVVGQLLRGAPAAKSGLINVNDKLLEVDGISVSKETPQRAMELIRGRKGTKVSLKLIRSGTEGSHDKPIQVQLMREDIALNSDRVEVNSEKFGNGIIGIVKLDTFYQSDEGWNSETDMRDAIHDLDKKGNLRGLIVDLRENSGGFLSQAVKVAGLFITNGVVVISKYFNGEEHFYRDMDGKTTYDGPLIILTSKATASAAEIVAQALQDYGVAVIVGDERTYGKGTIQSQTVTGDEGSTYFKVTVGQYYTVSGKTPQMQGVKADIVVPSQLLHENVGEEYLDFPIKEDKIPSAFNDNLTDIPANLKSWYMKYYVPTLQHHKTEWVELLPMLKKNSKYRISQNPRYQSFLQGKPVAFEDPAKREEGSSQTFQSDIQLDEAINIMKDMIVLEQKTWESHH